ncbi:MAG TPA: peptide ligase PGM1-related protein [Actinomycetota bacterium]|nr:peptide ligase PGM1-related protein [Actinomycetota bacterium]
METGGGARIRGIGPLAPSELDEGTIVVLPSISFPPEELRKIVAIQHYEERLLCLLLLLRNPRLRMLFVSSMRVPEPVVDYYLAHLEDPRDAADRLFVLSLNDPSPRALTEKVLDDPYAPKRIAELGAATHQSYILPFNVSELEVRLSEVTGVPLYGPPLDRVPLGSKSGSRRVAQRAGVPILPGAEDVFDLVTLQRELERLRDEHPDATAAVIKLNDGFSGQGNSVVRLDALGATPPETPTVFCAAEESWETYGPKVEQGGAVVELLMRDPRPASPSVQMRILPDGNHEIVSTHDQLLGGPDDQVYLGCRFPADDSYRDLIQGHAHNIAKVLAAEGVIGSFAMDFVVTLDREAYLSEINLRMGGTTHPFLMARFASGGRYDEVTGELMTDRGPRVYVATDNLKSERYVGIDPIEVIAALKSEGLAFHRRNQTGILVHLLGALRGYGKVGATCIGESSIEADGLYAAFVGLLDELAASHGQ